MRAELKAARDALDLARDMWPATSGGRRAIEAAIAQADAALAAPADEREAFEAWCCKRWAGDRGALGLKIAEDGRYSGEYENGHVQFAYSAWTARSRLGSHADVRVVANPLEWDQDNGGMWTDKRVGFSIIHEPDDELPFSAAWGEGDAEQFATLDEAKAWCQAEIDGWIAQNATIARKEQT